MSLGSMQNPAVVASAPLAPKPSGLSGMIQSQAQSAVAPSAAQPSKFSQLQGALGGIKLPGNALMPNSSKSAGSMLGADALSTDWAKLFGSGNADILKALTGLGISAAPKVSLASKFTIGGGGSSNTPYGNTWLKQMGLA